MRGWAGSGPSSSCARPGSRAGSAWSGPRCTCPTTGRRCRSSSSPATGSADRLVLRTEEGLDELGVRTHLGLRAVALRPGEVELSDGAVAVRRRDRARHRAGRPRRCPASRPACTRCAPSTTSLALRDRRWSGRVDAGGRRRVHRRRGGELGARPRRRTSPCWRRPAACRAGAGPGGRRWSRPGCSPSRASTLRSGVTITGFVDPGDGGVAVELADGEQVDRRHRARRHRRAARPGTGWRAPALDITDGLPCDAAGRVEGLDGVWAVGDVAAWADPTAVRHRHEHWTSAGRPGRRRGAGHPRAPSRRPRPCPTSGPTSSGSRSSSSGGRRRPTPCVPLHGSGFDGGAVRGTVGGLPRRRPARRRRRVSARPGSSRATARWWPTAPTARRWSGSRPRCSAPGLSAKPLSGRNPS